MKREVTKTPCAECPFRRESWPGYLGESSAREFLGTTMADIPMPCHKTINYSSMVWREEWELGIKGKLCAGSLVFFANILKVSRDPERPRMEKDLETVFASPQEFLKHHER